MTTRTCVVICALAAAWPTGAQGGESYALLVAVQHYRKTELNSLQFTEDDITALADVLRGSGYGEEDIIVMTQRRGAEDARFIPTAAHIRDELGLVLKELAGNDTILVAFSGHGVQFAGETEAFFCAADARLTDHSTLISLKWVFDALHECRARVKILLVDACRNDPQSKISKAAGQIDLEPVGRRLPPTPPGGVAALFSCSAGEQSFEAEELGHGVFFNYVIEGLSGKADVALAGEEPDREVSLAELEEYVQKKVQRYARTKLAASQTPERCGQVRGSVTLATLSRQETSGPGLTTPAPLANEEVLAKNKFDGTAFLAANGKTEGITTTKSGLQYRVIEEGDGPTPQATDTVTTHYRGTLIDGTEFDNSYSRGEPASFPVEGVIAGWTEALQLMQVGSKWQVFIPAELAYGDQGAGADIGPGSTLIFEIELLKIETP
jgi:FKBP-type peptidyl-prolyl cis-trans isomerase